MMITAGPARRPGAVTRMITAGPALRARLPACQSDRLPSESAALPMPMATLGSREGSSFHGDLHEARFWRIARPPLHIHAARGGASLTGGHERGESNFPRGMDEGRIGRGEKLFG